MRNLVLARDLRCLKVSKRNEWIDFCANICVHFARAVFEQITRHIFDQSERRKVAPGTPSCLFYVRFPYSRQVMRILPKTLTLKR